MRVGKNSVFLKRHANGPNGGKTDLTGLLLTVGRETRGGEGAKGNIRKRRRKRKEEGGEAKKKN